MRSIYIIVGCACSNSSGVGAHQSLGLFGLGALAAHSSKKMKVSALQWSGDTSLLPYRTPRGLNKLIRTIL